MGRRCPENGDPLESILCLPPSTPWSSFPSSSSLHDALRQPSAPDFRSPRAALPAPIPWHGISNQPSCRGKSDRPLYVRRKYIAYTTPEDFLISNHRCSKTAADRYQPFQRENLPIKQREPRSQKRAGTETTLRTTWIEHPILPRFGFNDPLTGGGSKQVIAPETAVVRGGWNSSPPNCLFSLAEPKS